MDCSSSLIEIFDIFFSDMRVFIKRDDLVHPYIIGNKWRKLKYNLAYAKKNNIKTLISKGGAFSNHIHALATAGHHEGFDTIGIIRGEQVENPTLDYAKAMGMQLYFVDRSEFRLIQSLEDVQRLGIDVADAYFLPEGGTNPLAIEGTREIYPEVVTQLGGIPDFCCVAAGTGGTAAGLISSSFDSPCQHIVFSALKGDFLQKNIAELLGSTYSNWQLNADYHFGGYAKFDVAMIDFMNDFKQKHQIQLDPIYTAKLCYGVFDLIKKDFFPKGSTIVIVHTGGLQGIRGFESQHGILL